MKKLFALAAATGAAMLVSGCVIIGNNDIDDGYSWHGENAQPFDGARADCEARNTGGEGSTAFVQCMAEKGWTRSRR